MNYPLYTPVVLVIFKRPETTARVFQAIRQARPTQLFVVADGPRLDRPDEAERCAAARAVVEQVDWPCEVVKDYAAVNLGCARRLPTGLDWVFSQVETAIVLEDDCVPHPSFFRFCSELLTHYGDDSRIASISGQNMQLGRHRTPYSYYFSHFNHCWGWATWKRAWQAFDFEMTLWPEARKQQVLSDILMDPRAVQFWDRMLQIQYEGGDRTVWDFQWTLACWLQHRLGIIANVNLIANIGFGADSTHFTAKTPDSFNNLPTEAIEFPLRHPPFMVRHTAADRFTQSTLFTPPVSRRLRQKLSKLLHLS